MAVCVPRFFMSSVRGLTAIACSAPLAPLPIFTYWVCISFTRSRATLFNVSNSDLNSLPKVFVAAPVYLKYSLDVNLFLSKALVKDSVLDVTVRIDAWNFPVAFMLFIKFCA